MMNYLTIKFIDDIDLINKVSISSFLGRFKEDVFAQNFYAALCNNDYYVDNNADVIASFSWRTSAGIVAEIRSLVNMFHEDYMDWYCSGTMSNQPDYVREEVITDEINRCLNQIGLVPRPL